jgi:hypothetical protein
MAKKKGPVESSFNLWRRAIPRLRRTFRALDAVRAKLQDDDVAAQLALVDYELKANREVRETLHTEMKVRREVAELRKIELDGMTNDEVEGLLIKAAQRRGFRSVVRIRQNAVDYLIERGASPDAAHLLVDQVIPPGKIEAQRKPVLSHLRAHYDQLESELTEGIRGVEDLITLTTSSEEADTRQGPATTPTATDPPSEPDVSP